MKHYITFAVFLLLVPGLNAQAFDTLEMNALFSTLAKQEKAMGSISISKRGTDIYHCGFGYADLKNGVRPTENTKYRVGSVSKMFTATVIMQLVEEKKLGLADKLSAFFPEIPHAERIGIAQMLRHGSGLSDEKYFRWLLEGKRFKPGKKAQYANANYILLSQIAEKVENKPFGAILAARIFEPCGLKNTYYGNKADSVRDEAVSYRRTSAWEAIPPGDLSIPAGAGGVVSTPADLNVFLNRLFTGKLVSPAGLAQMEETEAGYGMGMMRVRYWDKTAYSHSGQIDGFKSRTIFFPMDNLAISYSFNGVNTPVDDVLIAVLNIYFNMKRD